MSGFHPRVFPALFTIESEYRLAMVRAELEFVTELVRRITEEGFGPIEMWRDIQRACAQQHEQENQKAMT